MEKSNQMYYKNNVWCYMNDTTKGFVGIDMCRTLSLLASSPYAYGSFLKQNCVDRVAMALPWSAKANPVVSRAIARTIYYLSVSSAVKTIADVYKEFIASPGDGDKAEELAKIAQAIQFLALVLSNEDLPHGFSCSRESEWDRWVLDLNLARTIESPHKRSASHRHARYAGNFYFSSFGIHIHLYFYFFFF